MGFNNKQVSEILRLVSTILWLGNVSFSDSTLTDTTACSVARDDEDSLTGVVGLLGVEKD